MTLILICQILVVQRFLSEKNTSITNCKFNIVDPGNFSTLHFDYDKRRHTLNVLYGPNVDSPLYFKEVIFESYLNVGAEWVLYAGDWNVSVTLS